MSELRLNTVTDKDTDKGVDVDALHYQNTQLVRNLGPWQPGLVFENKTDYATYNDQAIVANEETTLPYTTQGADPTASPDSGNVVPFVEVQASDLVTVREDLLGPGTRIYMGDDGESVKVGDTVPAGTTHLRVVIEGKPEIVAMSPVSSGSVLTLNETSADIGGVTLSLLAQSLLNVENVETLKTYRFVEGQRVNLLGYYSVGDGGGGILKVVPGSDANDTGDHNLNNGNKAVIEDKNHVNIMRYGIVEGQDNLKRVKDCFSECYEVDGFGVVATVSGTVDVFPKRLNDIRFKAIGNPFPMLVKFENPYNTVVNDIRCDANRLCDVAFYGNNGFNTSKIDGLFALNALDYCIKLENSFLGSIKNYYARYSDNVGIAVNLGHNSLLERGESHFCKRGVEITSGASCSFKTLDCSYNTEEDIYINTQAVMEFDGVYTEKSSGDFLKVGSYYSMVSVNNLFANMEDGGAILSLESSNSSQARYIHMENVNISNVDNPFRSNGGKVSNLFLYGKFDNVTNVDYSLADWSVVNVGSPTWYKNGKRVLGVREYSNDIGDISVGDTYVQYYKIHFSNYAQKIVFSETEASASFVTVEVWSDRGNGSAFVFDGSVYEDTTPSLMAVQTNGNFVQLINQRSDGEITEGVCRVSRTVK